MEMSWSVGEAGGRRNCCACDDEPLPVDLQLAVYVTPPQRLSGRTDAAGVMRGEG